MVEPIHLAPAGVTQPATPRRPALYADYLLEETLELEARPTPAAFPHLRWARRQLTRFVFVVLVVGVPLAILWRQH